MIEVNINIVSCFNREVTENPYTVVEDLVYDLNDVTAAGGGSYISSMTIGDSLVIMFNDDLTEAEMECFMNHDIPYFDTQFVP
jgi:hypothetical protein